MRSAPVEAANENMMGFVKVGKRRDFRIGCGRAVDVNGSKVAVFRTAEGFVAFTDSCPHMGASLADGRLSADTVQCAWHGWRFDLRTGRSEANEWACVAIHEVRIEGEDVLVSIPEMPGAPETVEEEDWPVWDPDRHLKKRL